MCIITGDFGTRISTKKSPTDAEHDNTWQQCPSIPENQTSSLIYVASLERVQWTSY